MAPGYLSIRFANWYDLQHFFVCLFVCYVIALVLVSKSYVMQMP